MKKSLIRTFALVLALVLTVCLCSCAKKEKKASTEVDRESLYIEVLKELVAEYGMPTVSEVTFKGVQAFEIIDLDGDEKEELFVICSKGDNESDAMIYTCKDGKAVKVWETETSGGFDKATIRKQDENICIFFTVSYRRWSSGIVMCKDGEYIDLYAGEEYNEEELERYQEYAKQGIGTENDGIMEIYLNRVGLSLEDEWETLAELSTGADVMGLDIEIKRAFRKNADECIEKLKALGINHNMSTKEILSKLPYYGDVTKCKMDKDMAAAYAEAIASMDDLYTSYPGESWSQDYELYAFLADPADDGMPILVTAYLNKATRYDGEMCVADMGELHEIQMWQYKDGKATDAKVQKLDYTNGFGEIDGKTYYRSIEFSHDVGHKRTANYYLIENGTITLKHTVDIYDTYGAAGEEAYFYGDLPGGKTYALTAENLSKNGWHEEKHGNFSSWYYVMHDGKNVTEKCYAMQHDEVAGFTETDEIAHINDVEYHITIYSEDAWTVKNLLKYYNEI